MTEEKTLKALIRAYAKRTLGFRLPFESFLLFCQKAAPAGSLFKNVSPGVLTEHLEMLSTTGFCQLSHENSRILEVVYPGYFQDQIRGVYKEISGAPDIPFPGPDFLGAGGAKYVTPLTVKTHFIENLKNKGSEIPTDLIQMNFPEEFPSMIVPKGMLGRPLLEISIYKIREYLNTQRNADYMRTRLISIFKRSEPALKSMLTNLQTNTKKAIDIIVSPNDFSFQFWSHLASSIIQEYRQKNNRLAKENSFCQAAFLVGYYNVYYKGLVQREKEIDDAMKRLDDSLRAEPRAFTLTELFDLPDPSGVSVEKKLGRNRILNYLEGKTKSPDHESLPELLRIKSSQNRDYYIHKDVYVPLLLKKYPATAMDMKRSIVNKWQAAMERFQKLAEMKGDQTFRRMLDTKLKAEDPLLAAMLRYDLLFLLRHEVKLGQSVDLELARMLDMAKKSLIPLDQLLGLDRIRMIQEARSRLPLWKTSVVLSFLYKLFTGRRAPRDKAEKKKAEEGVSAVLGASPVPRQMTASQSNKSYLESLNRLASHYMSSSGDLHQSLEELAAKWNPLYDEKAKMDLVEDVNSMIRDYLRKMKKGFAVKPPDRGRIDSMAQRLSENAVFDKIRRKEEFRDYLSLYMIKILGDAKRTR